ncbi:2,3,4,5-tetrahydropyridine-2,6-dicarboxylate N-succinyltransferase [Candidatus Vidania fulgoroideorum]
MFNFKVSIKKISKIFNNNKKNIDLSIGEVKHYKNKIIKKHKKNIILYNIYNTEKTKVKLIKSIKNYINKNYNISIKKKYITTTMGNRNALYNYFLTLKKNEKYIAVNKPIYPYYFYISKFFKKKIIYFKKIKDIPSNISLIIICNPENPTGKIYKSKIEKILKKIKKKKTKLIIDECYSSIYLKSFKSSCKLFNKYKKKLTIINSLSKRSCSPGLKSGYIISNKKNIKKINLIKNLSNNEISEYNSYLSIKLWKEEDHAKLIRKKYIKKIKMCKKILNKYKIKFIKPKGTFYIFINIKNTKKKSLNLCKYLYKKKKIKAIPGIIMSKENYIRIALVDKKEKCKKAMKEICKTLNKYKHKNIIKNIRKMEKGKISICYKKKKKWIVNNKLKKIILSYMMNTKKKIKKNNLINYDIFENYFYKRTNILKKRKIRMTYLSYVRTGAYIGKKVIMMPCFVNIGAYVGDKTLIDSWSTIGSCARIGKKVHISGGVGIGGVLEPINKRPVIIEDKVFIGARSEIVEGVIVKKKSVISMGVFIGKSTKIYDRIKKKFYNSYIPKKSVVVPGCLNYGMYSLYAVIIVKKKDIKTKKKTNINKTLRITK